MLPQARRRLERLAPLSDPDWLRRELVERARTVSEVAAELSVTTQAVRAAAAAAVVKIPPVRHAVAHPQLHDKGVAHGDVGQRPVPFLDRCRSVARGPPSVPPPSGFGSPTDARTSSCGSGSCTTRRGSASATSTTHGHRARSQLRSGARRARCCAPCTAPASLSGIRRRPTRRCCTRGVVARPVRRRGDVDHGDRRPAGLLAADGAEGVGPRRDHGSAAASSPTVERTPAGGLAAVRLVGGRRSVERHHAQRRRTLAGRDRHLPSPRPPGTEGAARRGCRSGRVGRRDRPPPRRLTTQSAG